MKKPVNKPKFTNTRKFLRKEKRQQKKINRKEHYLKKKSDFSEPKPFTTPGQFVKLRPTSPELVNNVSKKTKKSLNQPATQDILKRQQEKEKKEADKLKSQMNEQRRRMLMEANEDEDKIIKKLEKQLGLNKSRNKNNYFADDGLDYLLEVCERKTSEQIVAAEKHLADVEGDSDFDEDLATVTGRDVIKKKKRENNSKNKEINNSDDEMNVDEGMDSDEDMGDELQNEESEDMSDDDGDDDSNSDDEEDDFDDNDEKSEKESEPIQTGKSKEKSNKNITKEKVISEEDINKIFSEDEVSHLSDDDDIVDGTGDEETIDHKSSQIKNKPDVWEDIYGRKRDKEGNVIKEEKGVYIPPHLRNKDSASEKDIAQLKRQVKSVLNKVTGTNLHWSCTSVERLYSTHSRHSVSSVLCALWREALLARSLTPERLLAEHAALVAVLHANVGSEIGAHFLEELCREFDALMQIPQPIEDKTLDNLVASLAHLYRFKIFDASLLFDVLSRLTHALTEKNIDVALVCVRCAGAALRRDAPAALRTFTQHAHTSAVGLHAAEGSRMKYLLDVLLAIKNNNLNKIPNYDPSYVEHLIKITRSIVRKGNYITPLNIRLEDLLKAHERGKWWVVGSAWEGTRENTQTHTQTTLPTDQKLLELARTQRMNTDVRRSIFCVIMAAEDYMDAFEKLQHLGLKGQQEREVIHVLIACCLQEKIYNPYYSVLATKLCDFDRKYQLSIQYTVWDKIKELESLSKQAITNLAQFLIHLIMEKGLPLSILKIIQFSDLNKRTVQFMRQILLAIIVNADLQASLEVFHRISKPPKLHIFRESLRLFIQHFLIKNAGKQSTILNEEEMSTLKERVQEVDKILTMHENKLRF